RCLHTMLRTRGGERGAVRHRREDRRAPARRTPAKTHGDCSPPSPHRQRRRSSKECPANSAGDGPAVISGAPGGGNAVISAAPGGVKRKGGTGGPVPPSRR